MNRRTLRNRMSDEAEMDSDSSGHESSSEEVESNEYSQNESSSNETHESDTSDIEALPQEILEDVAVNPEHGMNSKDGRIEYTKEEFVRGRRFAYRQQSNIDRGPTPTTTAAVETPLSAFLLFLSPIEQHILRMTNLFGARIYHKNWELLTIEQMRAYFGLLLLAGVYRSYGECVTQLWDASKGRPIFRKTMSLQMFKKIQRCVRFDDREQRDARDKLSPIRFVFDKWSAHLKALYTVGKTVTVDEQLVPFRGRCPFRQYIPSKPAKYGIKIWVICDSETYYVHDAQVYIGRARNTAPEKNQGQRVVLDLCRGLTGRNVTCDNFFTTYDLAKELHKQRMTLVGTIRKNRKELPPILIDMKRKPLYHTEFVYEPQLQAILLSYVPRKNRSVTLLSTYHRGIQIDETAKKKPNLIKFYNKTKGGVDTLDEMVGTYRSKRKVNRWPMALFCNLLDISALNAFVIFTHIFPEWNSSKSNVNIRRRLFLVELGEDLTAPYTANRSRPPRMALQTAAVEETRIVTPITHLRPNNKRGRCYICTSQNNRNVFATRCDKCAKFICADHKYSICHSCASCIASK